MQQFILYRMRHDVNGLDDTARMESVKRELKMNHASAYHNMTVWKNKYACNTDDRCGKSKFYKNVDG